MGSVNKHGTEAAGSIFPLVKRESITGIIKYLGGPYSFANNNLLNVGAGLPPTTPLVVTTHA